MDAKRTMVLDRNDVCIGIFGNSYSEMLQMMILIGNKKILKQEVGGRYEKIWIDVDRRVGNGKVD